MTGWLRFTRCLSTCSFACATTAVAAVTTVTASKAASAAPCSEWAYPHPYGCEDVTPSRFLGPQDAFKKTVKQWDLPKLVEAWKTSVSEETWPWVWTWHNPNGPHAVHVGVDKHTLRACRTFAEESNRNNLTLVVKDVSEIEEEGHSVEDFYKARCAVIFSAPQQIDLNNGILMLQDERIICYDTLTLAHHATQKSEQKP